MGFYQILAVVVSLGLCGITTVGSSFARRDTWPEGQYSLMMADNSCPNHAHFDVGRRYHDLEDENNINEWSRNSNGFSGQMSLRGFELVFCTKRNNIFVGREWPEGSYCIHQYGSNCPTGFEFGSLYFDDEDDDNHNTEHGTLPGGEYGRNTKYFFCCRSDGETDYPIVLPPTKAFYLYPNTPSCQQIEGMRSTLEHMHFDCEDDDNENRKFGSLPWVDGTPNYTLHLCLYEPL